MLQAEGNVDMLMGNNHGTEPLPTLDSSLIPPKVTANLAGSQS